MPVVDSLEALPTGKDADQRTPGWWQSSKGVADNPVTAIKNFLATCEASKDLRAQGSTSDEVTFLLVSISLLRVAFF